MRANGRDRIAYLYTFVYMYWQNETSQHVELAFCERSRFRLGAKGHVRTGGGIIRPRGCLAC